MKKKLKLTIFINDGGFAPSPKSVMKVVMNRAMVTAEQLYSDVRLLLTKNFRKPITDHQ